jgi:ribonuclease Y
VDETTSGHPILASADIAARHGEGEAVVEAIRSLHPDHEPRIVEAILLQTANRISENRPGARKDNLDVFLERLSQLERIATDFPGVLQAYAVRAGKDLRVLVDTARVSDDRAAALSREIAQAIEAEASFPGEVRVSVVRETRAVTYAV